jgi:hypothetical protein
MCVRKFILIGCLPLTLIAASTVFARPLPTVIAGICVFDEHAPLASAPYYIEEDYGLGGYTLLKGAALFVAAEPGLTAEWLKLRLDHELKTVPPTLPGESCRPSMKNVRADVVSARNGFWIVYTTRDDGTAKDLLAGTGEIVAVHKARERFEDSMPRDLGKREDVKTPARY